MSKKNFTDNKLSKYVLRRDYSKIEKNFDEPNLLNLQKDAFNRFIEKELENTIKSIFPISSIGKRYTLQYLGMNLGDPKRTEKEARNEGKTYDRPLYVDLAIIDNESGEVKKTGSKSGKSKASNHDGIFFASIPMITEKGTFIVNGIEKFVISQIVRSPGAYVLTKSQIKLSNSRKRIQEGYICEILPSKGTLFFIFMPENKDFIQVMFRDAIGESTHTVSVTAFLKAIGLSEKEILSIFANHKLIKNSLNNEVYNKKDIFDTDELSSFRKNLSSSDSSRSYGVDTKLRDLYKQYVALKNELEKEGKNTAKEKELEEIIDNIISEKAAKDLVVNLSISTKSIDSRFKLHSKDISYQSIIYNHFFNVKSFDLSKAGRYKMNRKMRLSERLYQRVLAEDLKDSKGKILVKKNTLIQKQELDTIKQLTKTGELGIIHEVNLDNRISKLADGPVRYEKINVYQDNDSQEEFIPIIGTDTSIDKPTLCISDILSIISYVINLNYDIGFYDDIDHLGNKRLKLIDELLKTRAQAGLVRIEKFINDKLAIADGANKSQEAVEEAAKKALTVKSIINTKPFQISFKEFFNSHQLTQFLDQQNPLAELTNKRRISAMGPGGISREDPNLDIRDVHYSHYGKICPIETPEGMNIGLIMSLATYASTDSNGFLKTPYRVVKNGVITDEIKWLTALEEDEYIIACSNLNVEKNKFKEDKVLCRYRSSWEFFDVENVDFIDISPKQVVSIAASSIPFLENDDANRALMGANMQRQATPLISPVAPIVGTGNEYKIAHDSGMAVVYEENKDGVVTYVDGSLIKIKSGSDEKQYELTKFNKSNQNTCNNQVPIVSLGDKVTKGATIADGPAMSNGELALGQNVLVAFTTWSGYNYEDAIILSKRLFIDDIFTSIHIVEYSVECLKTKNGDEEITRDIPNVSESAKKYLDNEGIIMVGAEVKEGDILVGKISPKGQVELTSEEKLLQAIFGDKSKNHKETSLKVPHGGEGTVAMVKRFKVEDDYELNADVIEQIKVYVVQKRKIQIGDKMAGRHGNKGIISKIVPVEDMPHLEDGTIIDIMLNPLGVPSRMNIGQILELHLGIAMRKLALTKMLELYFDKKKPEDYSLLFGINEEVSKTLIKNIEKIISEKKIKDLKQAKNEFTDFDLTLVLSRSGIPREKLIYKAATPVFEGVNRSDLKEVMSESGIDPINSELGKGKNGKFKLIDGRTGEYFDGEISVGIMYMLKLDHMVDDKIHSRSVGPYSKITQQPLGGKSQNGGQRFGEMEVWALEAYGAAHNLRELLTIKSDDVKGRNNTYNAIIKGKPIPESGLPESFKLLTKQLQGLGLQVNITKNNDSGKNSKSFKDINDYISKMTNSAIKNDAEEKVIEEIDI
ncbi:MAG: DNA-directed RNA polymerase subunit beta [Malacoplasma sp.]|nr:DNA-directed RNA polymerase subunit beta [Malacoplasma sp.]